MFKSLTISRKLLLSSLIFLLPIAVLMYFFLVSYNQKIFFTENEIEGNNLLYQNVTLGNLLGKYHREVFLHKADLSDDTFKAKSEDVKALENKIDKTISTIVEDGSEFFADHKNRLKGEISIKSEYIKPGELAESWRELKAHADLYDKQEFTDAYIAMYKDLLSLIRYTGDISNLILDPDLDSYYLMDISLLTIPDVIYKQSLIHHYGDKFLLADTLERYEKQFTEFHLAHITDDILRHIEKSLATSINSDNEFYDISPTLADTLPLYFNKMHA